MPLDRSLYKETPVHADSDSTEPCPPCTTSNAASGSSSCRFVSIDVTVAVDVGAAAGKELPDLVTGSNILNEVAASSEGEVSGLERREEEKEGGSCRLRYRIEDDDACCLFDASGAGEDDRGVVDREMRELGEEDKDKEETRIGVVAEAEGEEQDEREEREKASLEFVVVAEGIFRVDRNGGVSCASPSPGVTSLLSNCPGEL